MGPLLLEAAALRRTPEYYRNLHGRRRRKPLWGNDVHRASSDSAESSMMRTGNWIGPQIGGAKSARSPAAAAAIRTGRAARPAIRGVVARFVGRARRNPTAKR